ncbi:MAG: heat-shock protein [Sphingomonas bacterium]|uniref:Hsp20/alpha crystallin family protein n=1 Tax=Sphingomonas bacterium TaxID=1895847 RepID=UPI0026161E72|nr:Hsp20/alpha crystallin family protein [Sphingomonas bacterium]MDB5709298.1 heat-shock protein [Sphingomonas bacterium]
MAIRDLIPWSRQENRLPAPVSGEQRERAEHPLLSLHREMNRLFDDVFRGFDMPAFGNTGPGAAWPRVELGESDHDIRVTAELPGLGEKDVDISLEEGVLTLRGEKHSQVEDRNRGYSERSYGRFERRIGLPNGIDRDRATASFENGVLTVVLPKTEAANENVRRIPVNANAA